MLVDDYFKKTDLVKLIANDPIMAIRYQQIEMEQRLVQVEEKTNEVEIQAAIAEEQATLAHKRIDSLDVVDPDGEPRQQLVFLVNKYAKRNGIQYNAAWSEFRQAFNIAFHTNIKLRLKNYAASQGIRRMTVPEYLEASGQLEDAIRVVSKMLNPPKRLTVV
jgi:vacuolar-type H+-ATPase subunit I/STV1